VSLRHAATLSAVGLLAAAVWGAVLLNHHHDSSGAGSPISSTPTTAHTSTPTPPTDTTDAELPVPQSTIRPGTRLPLDYVVLHPDNTAASVAAAVIQTSYGYDTRVDTSERDAALRAIRWLTADYRRQLHAPVVRNTPDWIQWSAHAAVAHPQLRRIPAVGGDVSAGGVLVSYQVRLTMTGRHHWTTGPTLTTVTATCVKSQGTWLVDRLDVL
jgi:hypothetical protein